MAENGRVLSAARWNRTFLHRQRLMGSHRPASVTELVRMNVALQSQDPQAAHFALRCRDESFDPAALDASMISGDVVRIAAFRSTVMTVLRKDVPAFRAVAGAAMQNEALRIHAPRLVGARVPEVVAYASEVFVGQDVSVKDLSATLGARWPTDNPATLTTIARCMLPLVQIPPRGTWRASAAITYRHIELPPDDADHRLNIALRYLSVFGPSTLKAIQTWMGVTGMKKMLTGAVASGEVEPYTGPEGEVLFDVSGGEIADADASPPTRLLAPFDHAVVANADRRRIVDDDVYRAMSTPNGLFPGFVLFDGHVVGTWKPFVHSRSRSRVVEVTYVCDVSARAKKTVNDEVERLTEFCNR